MQIIPKIVFTFLLVAVILIIPQVYAQSESIPEVTQKLVKITISENGTAKVVHQIANSNEPRMLKFIDGTVTNLEFIDRVGRYQSVDVFDGMTSIPILEDQGEIFVRYDLNDAIILKNDTWTMDFRYLQKTTFYLPEKLDMVYVNENPVVFDDNRGFVCHGCQMVLEYSFAEKPIAPIERPIPLEDKEPTTSLDGFSYTEILPYYFIFIVIPVAIGVLIYIIKKRKK